MREQRSGFTWAAMPTLPLRFLLKTVQGTGIFIIFVAIIWEVLPT
jgi:hypothetical protein